MKCTESWVMKMSDFKDVFESIVNSVPDRSNSSDYVQDGILYCGTCRTPKQTIVGDESERYVCPIMCKCEREKYENEKHDREVKELRDFCFRWFPELIGCTFDKDTEKGQASDVCRRYTEIFDESEGLLLYGDVGTGKTFYAACICNALVEKGKAVSFVSLEKLINMSQTERNYISNGLATCDAVVLDDLGVERDTTFGAEVVYSVVNRLYASPSKMIITTNLSMDDMSKCQDLSKKRIYDRILQRCYPVKIDGESKRLKKGRENIRRMRKLLEEKP